MDIAFAGCLVFLAAAFITDIRSMIIPNKITVSAACAGFIYQIWAGCWSGLWTGILGAVTGFGIMLILYWAGAVGGGDVKLFGGIGAWMGAGFTFYSLVYSIIFAGIIGIVILIWRRESLARLRALTNSVFGALVMRSTGPVRAQEKEMLSFPFMLAVIPGVIVAYWYM
ncbi:prepilin peptidase [Paenibacillus sp. J22TS3]|uniref:A24 family peptidase n=1 Tax=Paenibacillus sp. J22TS3 TaxID=2807192 RepID=UPI001B0FF81B|nr:A24 family peptidase [Paenibacillus sp. J22TS3]GIP22588.1 hypothetical protein J22TS3_28630 [Paenibacillus sp. J22TS3]